MRAKAPPQLLVDLSELVRHDARSGIQRVVRGMLQALLAAPPAGYAVRPVYDAGGYYAYAELGQDEQGQPRYAAAAAGHEQPLRAGAGDLLVAIDLSLDSVVRNRAVLASLRQHGVGLYFMVYDLLPVHQPGWFADGMGEAFTGWLHTVAELADGLICNARATADELMTWLEQHPPRRALPLHLGCAALGADLAATLPTSGIAAADAALLAQLAQRPTLLMVGTLEPRKMQGQALDALEMLWQQDTELNLVIVGKPGWRMAALERRLRQHAELGRRLFWLERASDELLLRLYRDSSALLAASRGEGYGLPLIEAAQHGLPVIARDLLVFREVAGAHAWYFTAADGTELAAALRAWLALFQAGQAPASAGMPRLDWAASTAQLLDCVLGQRWYRRAPVKLP
ncbi:glycosyltransferase involved in cell wall biosynthesis [Duganella sp. 1224]|uniref:glycosyltransferase family 4 protein n=1 Tax=Duganella sp. 1224 TaxID=2587052 RepID=UPI0015C9FA0C|nr:glycosyltransferase family 1 protein [Duganella sp. 1224]NYE61709.1 glycosyltransferase involved in cell wall biosynthesis [Duganella sp. 1224]